MTIPKTKAAIMVPFRLPRPPTMTTAKLINRICGHHGAILGTCYRSNGFCCDGGGVNFQTHRSLEEGDREGNTEEDFP